MSRPKNRDTIEEIILIMATKNDFLSEKELAVESKCSLQTVRNYLKSDLNKFIEPSGFETIVARNTGRAKTLVQKYRLQKNLDILLLLFEYLNIINIHKLFKTVYYKNLRGDIKKRLNTILSEYPTPSCGRMSSWMDLKVNPSNLKISIDSMNIPKSLLIYESIYNSILDSPKATYYILKFSSDKLKTLTELFDHHLQPYIWPSTTEILKQNLDLINPQYTIIAGLYAISVFDIVFP